MGYSTILQPNFHIYAVDIGPNVSKIWECRNFFFNFRNIFLNIPHVYLLSGSLFRSKNLVFLVLCRKCIETSFCVQSKFQYDGELLQYLHLLLNQLYPILFSSEEFSLVKVLLWEKLHSALKDVSNPKKFTIKGTTEEIEIRGTRNYYLNYKFECKFSFS